MAIYLAVVTLFLTPGFLRLIFPFAVVSDWWNRVLAIPLFNLGILCFAVDRERHRAVVHQFLEATRGKDLDKMVALLDENVVLHGDGDGKAFATKRPVVGGRAVAQFVIAVTGTLPPDATVEEIEINGRPRWSQGWMDALWSRSPSTL
jgi:hypothetical protein